MAGRDLLSTMPAIDLDSAASDRLARQVGDLVTVTVAMLPSVPREEQIERLGKVNTELWKLIAEFPFELQTAAAVVATSVLLLRLGRREAL